MLVKHNLKKGLSDEFFQIYKVFDIDQKYLMADFNANKISQITGIEKRMINQLVLRKYNMNLNNLIRSYRVNYIKYLTSSAELSRLDYNILATMSGYNSIRRMKIAFKKETGISLKDYLKLLKLDFNK